MKKIILVLCCALGVLSAHCEKKNSFLLLREIILSSVEGDYDYIYDGYTSDSTFIALRENAFWLVNLYSGEKAYLCEECKVECLERALQNNVLYRREKKSAKE